MDSERMDGFCIAHIGSEKKTDCEILREKRIVLGLTQKQVAEKAGVAFVTYQRFESGERNIRTASFQLVCRILTALEMGIDAFYNGDYVIGEEVYGKNGEFCYKKTGRSINEDVE